MVDGMKRIPPTCKPQFTPDFKQSGAVPEEIPKLWVREPSMIDTRVSTLDIHKQEQGRGGTRALHTPTPSAKRKYVRALAQSPGCNLEIHLLMSTSRPEQRDRGLTSLPLMIVTKSSLTSDGYRADPSVSVFAITWMSPPDSGFPWSKLSRTSMEGPVG